MAVELCSSVLYRDHLSLDCQGIMLSKLQLTHYPLEVSVWNIIMILDCLYALPAQECSLCGVAHTSAAVTMLQPSQAVLQPASLFQYGQQATSSTTRQRLFPSAKPLAGLGAAFLQVAGAKPCSKEPLNMTPPQIAAGYACSHLCLGSFSLTCQAWTAILSQLHTPGKVDACIYTHQLTC